MSVKAQYQIFEGLCLRLTLNEVPLYYKLDGTILYIFSLNEAETHIW
jgi:hypothetical protein